MSSNTTNLTLSHGYSWAGFSAWFGRAFEGYVARRSRTDRIQALEALNDNDLAALGIRRDQIVQYVFRDIYWS